jgi:YidC/Oxa1 family membrane protein insertase
MILKTGWAEDPQQKMIQRLMLYGIPLSLLVSGSLFPIGVIIYWVTNNLFTLVQQQWVLASSRRRRSAGSKSSSARPASTTAKGRREERDEGGAAASRRIVSPRKRSLEPAEAGGDTRAAHRGPAPSREAKKGDPRTNRR